MSRNYHRDISPFLQKLRGFLLGREHKPGLRFPDEVATRSPDPPILPDGPHHKLSANYYYTRDVRREVQPPELLAGGGRILLESGAGEVAPKCAKGRTPGQVYRWD